LFQAFSLDQIGAWEDAWRELDGAVLDPMSRFSWARAAYAAFVDDASPHVVAAFAGERLLAVAPLVKRRIRGVARLLPAGSGELEEPAGLAWSDSHALDRLAHVLVRGGAPVTFDRMPADSPALAAMRRASRGRAIVVARPVAASSCLSLDESWIEPERHLDARGRAALRSARREAEQLGAVTTEIHTPDLRDLPALVDAAFELDARSDAEPSAIAPATNAAESVFYRHFAQAACVEGILRVCILRIGGRAAAVQLAVEHGGGFWLLEAGHDARFAACSPAILLTRDTVRYAAEAGLHSYEFAGAREPWTKMWPLQLRHCVSLSIYPIGLRGLWALTADLVAGALAKRSNRG
jgi:CelD/BcsL family acetyltransferase involved in cellulose biosynthesis